MSDSKVWVREDRKGYIQAHPSDTPCRKDGQLTTLSEVEAYDDVEVHVGGGWSKGSVIPTPVKRTFTIEVLAEQSVNELTVLREVDSLLSKRPIRDSNIIGFEISKKSG